MGQSCTGSLVETEPPESLPAAARAALAESTPTQPWELQVASCLKVMCTDSDGSSARRNVAAMIKHFVERDPVPGYGLFRTQLGLTVTTLARVTDSAVADRIFARAAGEVIEAGDGYAARDALRYPDTQAAGLTGEQRDTLYDCPRSGNLAKDDHRSSRLI